MTHKIVNAGDRMFCTMCGEEGTTRFSAVCAPAKVELDAAAAQENKRLSVCILVSLIVLVVTVFFSHGIATFGDKMVTAPVSRSSSCLGLGLPQQTASRTALAAAC